MKRFLSVVAVNAVRVMVAPATKVGLAVGMIFPMVVSLVFSPFHVPLIVGYLQAFRGLFSRFTASIRPFF